MNGDVWVVGVGMTRFARYPDRDTLDLGVEAAAGALTDAGFTIFDVHTLAAGSQFLTSPGQKLLKQLGQPGIPVFNVTNACATGATAFRTAHLTIKAGEADIGLAVGMEQLGKAGLLGRAAREAGSSPDVFEPLGRDGHIMATEGVLGASTMPAVFAQIGIEYASQHGGVGPEQFAKVAQKNHAFSALNPLAQYQKVFSLEEILAAEVVAWPNTIPMCCPTGDGAAAAVLVSDTKLRTLDPDVRRRAVKVSASVLTSDAYSPGQEALLEINSLTQEAADQAYEQASLGPPDLDLVELHDCFATAELVHYDNLRLCAPGEAGRFIDTGGPDRDGRTPVNVSGGLLSKGHPIGATGLANIYEVVTHLRGEAGSRQVDGATVGLTHVLGLASACAVHIFERRVS